MKEKGLKISSADKDTEQEELSYTASRNAKWCHHFGKQFSRFFFFFLSLFSFFIYFEREGERETQAGEGQRERGERESQPGSMLSAGSPTYDLHS